ncbi:MAG: hypothetical protein GY773_03725 [Actinomycetia bacterium]|nr:hypothetical protein [Actinomycetes bacterium]
MTTPEQIAADLARLEADVSTRLDIAYSTLDAAATELAAGIRKAHNDLAALTSPPASPTVLAGPSWSPSELGPLDEATIHAGHNVDAIHLTEGIQNLVAVPEGIRWHAKGQPAHVQASRAQAWLPIPELDTITETFHFTFEPSFDFGAQAKFGYGLMGYHSGQRFPGGGYCHGSDWLIRPMWHAFGGQPLRFALYIYSTGDDKARLDGQNWQSDCIGGGYRRLVRLGGYQPTEDTAYTWQLTIHRNPASNQADITVQISDDHTVLVDWEAMVLLNSPANRTPIICSYGGNNIADGPHHDTSVLLSDLEVLAG